MKKILLLFLMLCFALPSLAIQTEFMNYYNIDKEGMETIFVPISKERYKQLTKEEKIKYKKIKSIEKKIQKANKKNKSTYNLLQQNKGYAPLETSYFFWLIENKKYDLALVQLLKIKENYCYLFDADFLNIGIATLYYYNSNYEKFIETFNKKETNPNVTKIKNSNLLKYMLAYSFYNLEEYSKAIFYARELEKEFNNTTSILHILAHSYSQQKNFPLALKYFKKLYKISPSYDYAFNIGLLLKNKDAKIKYFKIARELAQNIDKKVEANTFIILYEQQKIKNAIKRSGIYIKEPDFFKIMSDCPYGNESYWINRQDDFYVHTNVCIENYYGKNLKSCFESVIEEEEEKTENFINQVYREQQLALQQQQIRLQQLSVYEQNRQNYLLQQQNYILNRPRQSSSTTFKYGNMYFTDTYTY